MIRHSRPTPPLPRHPGSLEEKTGPEAGSSSPSRGHGLVLEAAHVGGRNILSTTWSRMDSGSSRSAKYEAHASAPTTQSARDRFAVRPWATARAIGRHDPRPHLRPRLLEGDELSAVQHRDGVPLIDRRSIGEIFDPPTRDEEGRCEGAARNDSRGISHTLAWHEATRSICQFSGPRPVKRTCDDQAAILEPRVSRD
jgi:hypothetical protein